MVKMKNIAVLGSTGSIGRQVMDVARNLSSFVKISSISAYSNIELIKAQIKEFSPGLVSVWHEKDALELKSWCRRNNRKTKVLSGADGLKAAAVYGPVNLVIAAVVGSAGLEPLISAINAGKDIALANKEALVAAGDIVMKKARQKGVKILPVDSEHSAIFQCIGGSKNVSRLILTASGGPFYRSNKAHSKITVEDALAHPTWVMGKKITVDSATLMNKGLEAIEAHHLFGIALDKIDIVIHPQSIVHSLVEFTDGSVLAQMSNPDMRLPIQYAITYPERMKSEVKKLDLPGAEKLEFFKPDFKKFPCLGIALGAAKAGGTMPAVMNAANESAVKAFLEKKIGFDQIPVVIKKVMSAHKVKHGASLAEIIKADSQARVKAEEIIQAISCKY